VTARFAGRVALVTGAASSIRRATAVGLAVEGATVAVVDRDEAWAAAMEKEPMAPSECAVATTKPRTLPILPSESDLALLRAYDWPGNVREMGAIMDRAIIMARAVRRTEIAESFRVDR
jgi:NAD(P)-dependent dehydrogenase (short-subunit alcohol dehydrogenase family)